MNNQSLTDQTINLTDLIRFGMKAEISGDMLVINKEWGFKLSTLSLNKLEKFHIVSALVREDFRAQNLTNERMDLERVRTFPKGEGPSIGLDESASENEIITFIDEKLLDVKGKINMIRMSYEAMFNQ
jgi:hypothetical protein